jgi:hypothetical protein
MRKARACLEKKIETNEKDNCTLILAMQVLSVVIRGSSQPHTSAVVVAVAWERVRNHRGLNNCLYVPHAYCFSLQFR